MLPPTQVLRLIPMAFIRGRCDDPPSPAAQIQRFGRYPMRRAQGILRCLDNPRVVHTVSVGDPMAVTATHTDTHTTATVGSSRGPAKAAPAPSPPPETAKAPARKGRRVAGQVAPTLHEHRPHLGRRVPRAARLCGWWSSVVYWW